MVSDSPKRGIGFRLTRSFGFWEVVTRNTVFQNLRKKEKGAGLRPNSRIFGNPEVDTCSHWDFQNIRKFPIPHPTWGKGKGTGMESARLSAATRRAEARRSNAGA